MPPGKGLTGAAWQGRYRLIAIGGRSPLGQTAGSKIVLASTTRLQIFLSNEYSFLTPRFLCYYSLLDILLILSRLTQSPGMELNVRNVRMRQALPTWLK